MAKEKSRQLEEIQNELDSFKELAQSVSHNEEISSLREMVQDFVNDLSADLFFNVDVQRLINKFLWETREALGFTEMSDCFSAYGEDFLEEIAFGNLKVNFFNSKYNFVLPDEIEGPVFSGNGNGLDKKETQPRVRLMYELLSEWGIQNVSVFNGTTLSSQFRKVPYKLFIIEELDRAVLICEESGNRTFVKSGLSDLEKFSFSRKSELKEMDDVRSVVWNGAENWKERMSELLVLNFEEEGGGVVDEESEEEIEEEDEKDDGEIEESERGGEEDLGKDESVEKRRFPEMNREYFTKENVRRDLDAFCKKAGLSNVSELHAGIKLRSVKVICSNGDVLSFRNYLRMFFKNSIYEIRTEGQALEKLKNIYGIKKIDREYFTEENVRRDLDAFCKKAGISDVSELKVIPKFFEIEVLCSNGELLSFNKYLRTFLEVFIGVKLTLKQALDELIRIYGFESCLLLHKEYFTKENVRKDLDAYSAKAGLSFVSDINTNNISSCEVLCANNRIIKFSSYLYMFSKAFNIASEKEAIDCLFRIYGVSNSLRMSSRNYFTKENVRKDLDAYCAKAGIEDIGSITANNLRFYEVECVNKKRVKFPTYIYRFKRAFNIKSVELAIKELLRIYGYEKPSMDSKDYFVSKNVRRDLDAYCARGGLSSVLDITTGNISSIKVECVSGKTVSFMSYLIKFKNIFSLDSYVDALIELKKIYGVECPFPMTKDYFTKENVRKDLDAYCEKLGCLSVMELSGRDKSLEALCANKEVVRFLTYIERVSKIFNIPKGEGFQNRVIDFLIGIYNGE